MKSTVKKGTKGKSNNSSTDKLMDGKSFRKYYYLLGFFTFFIFANTIGNGYNMDDGIVTNGHKLTSQGISALDEIFTSNYYKDNMGYAFGYRPMVHVSFAIEHELFGEKPGAGHFINVILFALTVVLFFKLLLRWVGEKNLLFAGITSILFAVHPIHTEVVDSLKNRDELLAFLFVLWSGLSAFKYLEKGKWLSIFSIVLLFSLAMLSKKSVFPMAIVLPAAMILFKDISAKKLVILFLSFIIPAAIIGSELQLVRAGLMILLPAIILVSLFLIKTNYLSLSEEVWNEQFTKFKPCLIPILMIALAGLAAILFSSYIALLVALPAIFWLFKINYELGLLTLIFLLIGVDVLWIRNIEFGMFVLILGFGYGMYRYLQDKKLNAVWTSVGIISLVYFVFENFKPISGTVFLGLIIFVFLLQRKALLAMAFVVVVFVVDGFSLYISLLSLISVSLFLFEQTKNKNWVQYIPVIAFGITTFYIGYENYQLKDDKLSSQLAIQEKQDFVRNENILKEGRKLEFVENTLTAPHTKEEKIGTGFATLGEYFRLMVFPYELSFYYGFAKTNTLGLKNFWVWLFIIIHIGMIILAFFHIRKNSLITIGVLWYLSGIILFSNWIELVAGMVGERLAFTASAGFCVLVAGILFWIKPDLNLKRPGVVGYTLMAIVFVFTGRTVVRNADWKDTITLMSHDIKHLGNSSQANNIYAMHLMAESTNNRLLTKQEVKEMQQKAIFHFDEAVKIWPDYFNVYIDKARAYIVMGDYQSAVKSLEKAIKIDPNNEYSYYIIVDVYDKLGDGDSYLKYGKILFDFRQNEQTYGVLARGYYLINEKEKSKEILLEALQKYPNNEPLKYNLNLVNQELN